jgi:nicotinamide riboside kinase
MALRNITDTDLTFNDFLNFVIGQNNYYKDSLNALNNNGVIISDTDNLVTLMYAKAYSTNPEMIFDEDDYKLLYNCVKTLNGDITWDKIFILPPKNTFVDDGTRYMGQSSIEERTKNYNCLIKLLEEFDLLHKVEVLDGTFYENFIKVKNYINDLYV